MGVIIDEKLNWTHHISYIKNKISTGFGIILRARNFFNKSTILKLYNSFVLPYLIYCVEIWGNASEIHILPIIIIKKKNYSSSHLFTIFSTYQKHFHWFKNDPLQDVQMFRCSDVQMFKYNNGNIPRALSELFTLISSSHSYDTRNRDKIRYAYGKHKFMYRNFRFTSVYIWNYLASNININTSFFYFKNK